ncbi:MAG: hypothetical protein ABI537_05670 [Casimicrobiaceae bacterium]
MAIGCAMVTGNAAAMSKDAQEFMEIQTKIAPDQCTLQRLSSQSAAAARAGDLAKRQELIAQMEPVAKRIQSYQPRMQELSKSVQSNSPDFSAAMQQTQELRNRCKP